MKFQLKKMKTEFTEHQVQYYLKNDSEDILLNSAIGKQIEVVFEGQINCVNCGRKTSKSFGEGFCFPCFQNAPQAAECIIRPELCQAHLGKGRDIQWEEEHHNRAHYVYLAVSSEVKVGITNHKNIPYRWIDQGASYAIKVAKTPYRQLAGQIEVALKEHYTDRTQWQKMLKNEVLEDEDIETIKWELGELLPSDLTQFMDEDDEVTYINYPVLQYPKKVTSINLDKTPVFNKKLIGIKGQYFIFEDNSVINIRKYSGYQVQLNF